MVIANRTRTSGRPKTTPESSRLSTATRSELDSNDDLHSGELSHAHTTEASCLKPTTSSRQHQGVDTVHEEGAFSPSTTQEEEGGGGGFKKGTVTAMATSRAQEAMLRHQVWCYDSCFGSLAVTFVSSL
jgi:hypothetical protein